MMKLAVLLFAASFATLGSGSPFAGAPNQLQERADQWCTLDSSVKPPGHCRKYATTGAKIIHNITRSDRFGVRCVGCGEEVNRD
jgi:hypothetical protein